MIYFRFVHKDAAVIFVTFIHTQFKSSTSFPQDSEKLEHYEIQLWKTQMLILSQPELAIPHL